MSKEDQKATELVATAVQTAMEVTETAAAAAKEVVKVAAEAAAASHGEARDDDDRVTRALATALRRVFGENEETQRFVDVSKIPLICKSIVDMHKSMEEIKDRLDTRYVTVEAFGPYKKALNLIATAVLGAIVVAILSTVIIK